MMFTYKVEELHGPMIGWLVVAYTEFAAKVASLVSFKFYDNYRLWALSPDMIRCIRELDLTAVLGCRGNADEIIQLLRVIERTNFAVLEDSWTARGSDRSFGAWAERLRGGLVLLQPSHGTSNFVSRGV